MVQLNRWDACRVPRPGDQFIGTVTGTIDLKTNNNRDKILQQNIFKVLEPEKVENHCFKVSTYILLSDLRKCLTSISFLSFDLFRKKTLQKPFTNVKIFKKYFYLNQSKTEIMT